MATRPTLVSADELSQLLDASEVQVIQVTSLKVYRDAHIPGAVLVPPDDLICGIPPAPGRLPSIEKLNRVFGNIGYEPDTNIVVCDDEGGGWAGRLAWTLDVIGHEKWCYLDGGLRAWVANGLPLVATPTPVVPHQVNLTISSTPIAEISDIAPRLADEDLVIWDCRSIDEYDGTRLTAARAGHIPGARHLDWVDLVDEGKHRTLIKDAEALLRERGIVGSKDIITHCQTHHRSGLTYMTARLLGFPRIRAYHGSWSEWGNRADTPVETGPPEQS
ncbi:MAG: rhodanese-like domain-containing protein [Pseudomonadales bacterium]